MKYSVYIKDLIGEGIKRQMSKTFIYLLRHPGTNEIRYVGKTKDPRDRYHAHMKPKNRLQKLPLYY
jgi:hypothetical protein